MTRYPEAISLIDGEQGVSMKSQANGL